MYEQVFQQALHTLSQEGSPYVSLQWRNIRNESMWTTFYKLYSSPKWFGRFAEDSRRSSEDLPLVQCRERSDVSDGSWQTFWGSPANPNAYLQEVAAYLDLLEKHWRPVSITKLHPHTYNRLSDPWEPRWENAVKAVRRARTGSRMVRSQQAYDEFVAIQRIADSLSKHQLGIGTMDLYYAGAAILRARQAAAERSGADTTVALLAAREVDYSEMRHAGIFNDAMDQTLAVDCISKGILDQRQQILAGFFKKSNFRQEMDDAALAILRARQAAAEPSALQGELALLKLALRPVTIPELRNAGIPVAGFFGRWLR